MIKKLFKWIYFLLSGLSFILVLMLIAFFGYLYIAEDEVKLFVKDFDEYRAFKKNENLFEVVDIDQEVMMMDMNSKPSEDNSKSGTDPKIKIKIKDGIAYLRPSQILYIESGENYHVLTAVNGRQIQLNKRETPLKRIGANLNEYLCFIALKSYIINCNYIEQVKRISEGNYSKTYVIMENEHKIPIPEKSVQKVLNILETIHE